MYIIIIAAAVFGLCFLVDKGFTRLFRSSAQHRSGLSVRQNKRYGSIGLILFLVAVMGFFTGLKDSTALVVGSVIVALLGVGLIAYYMSSGIYYDEDGFVVESLGKKRRTYRYGDIVHQQLYVLQGGSLIVELHMTDGKAVQVVSHMTDYDRFLRYAFEKWCRAKGLDPENCDFHDPQSGCWFPEKEES